MHLLHNFHLVPAENFTLSYTNRAFQYNDGLFDTIMVASGKIRFLPDHLERIQQALEVLQIEVPQPFQHIELFTQYVQELAVKNNLSQELGRLKVHIWRAPGGLFTPEQNTAETLLTLHPQSLYPLVIPRVDFASSVRNSFSPLSFFKGPFATKYVLASLEKKQKQLDELILLDEAGHVSEALTANIFWLKKSILYTPALTTGCIAGIVRKNILRLGLTNNLKITEGLFPVSELLSAEIIFISNVTGLRAIQFVGHKEFPVTHPLLHQLNTTLFTG